jgi:uncharacterized protein
MLSLLPDYGDPLRLCALGKTYEGRVALADLPRLAPLLTSLEGEAAFALAFRMDEERRAVVSVEVRAELWLPCQRCMQPMKLLVDESAMLAVVSGPDEAERLPDDLDPLLVAGNRLALRSLVEDELILAVPVAPMHPPSECVVRLDTVNADVQPDKPATTESVKDNPFAVLASLKSDTDEDH